MRTFSIPMHVKRLPYVIYVYMFHYMCAYFSYVYMWYHTHTHTFYMHHHDYTFTICIHVLTIYIVYVFTTCIRVLPYTCMFYLSQEIGALTNWTYNIIHCLFVRLCGAWFGKLNVVVGTVQSWSQDLSHGGVNHDITVTSALMYNCRSIT